MQETRKQLDQSTNHLGLPPPGALDLIDGDRVVGWVKNNRVGFRGFGSELEAASAAWAAYRTMSRRLARRTGERPVPIDIEQLGIQRTGDLEMIAASGREFARLVRLPGEDGTSGFAFEITVPGVDAELDVRAKAYAMYRTLRRSGIAWEMFRTKPQAPRPKPQPVRDEDTPAEDTPAKDEKDSALGYVARFLLTGIAVVLAVVILLSMPRQVIGALALVLATGFVAGGALILADGWGERRRGGGSGYRRKGVNYAEARQ